MNPNPEKRPSRRRRRRLRARLNAPAEPLHKGPSPGTHGPGAAASSPGAPGGLGGPGRWLCWEHPTPSTGTSDVQPQEGAVSTSAAAAGPKQLPRLPVKPSCAGWAQPNPSRNVPALAAGGRSRFLPAPGHSWKNTDGKWGSGPQGRDEHTLGGVWACRGGQGASLSRWVPGAAGGGWETQAESKGRMSNLEKDAAMSFPARALFTAAGFPVPLKAVSAGEKQNDTPSSSQCCSLCRPRHPETPRTRPTSSQTPVFTAGKSPAIPCVTPGTGPSRHKWWGPPNHTMPSHNPPTGISIAGCNGNTII